MGTFLALAGVVLAAAAVYLAVEPQRAARQRESADRFVRVRGHLKRHVGTLLERSLAEQDRFRPDKDLPVLAEDGWIPSQPLPLESVLLELTQSSGAEAMVRARREVRKYLPRREGGVRADTYSEAVGLFDPPGIWHNSRSYRLVKVTTTREPAPAGAGTLHLTFSLAHYFDGHDTSDFLAYEAADRDLMAKRSLTGSGYRSWLADPFDLRRRCALPGVCALTIRHSDREAFFFLLYRDGAKVAYSMNTTGVVPGGEFQPHNDVLPAWQADLDLWRNVMREYAEEFLGVPESMGQGGTVIDYENSDPYRRFARARREGLVTIRFLGLCIDPLSWKPMICLVCLWQQATFDRIFMGMAPVNREGVLITGEKARHGFRGLRFDAATVLGYADDPLTDPPARMCLTLAWRWRHHLQIPSPGQ